MRGTAVTEHRARAIEAVLADAKRCAREYYELAGRPLGVNGEVAEYEVHRLLGAKLTPPREPGADAVLTRGGRRDRVQIKGRCFVGRLNPGARIGSIRGRKGYDAVLMVLLDARLETTEIWYAPRAAVLRALDAPGSRARNERRALSIAKFRQIGRKVWPAAKSKK